MESNKAATQNGKVPPISGVPIEDLPLADRVKLAEAANPFEGIAPGWFIDAKDTVDNWCVAYVLKTDGGDIVLNYDGWSPKYDMVSWRID